MVLALGSVCHFITQLCCGAVKVTFLTFDHHFIISASRTVENEAISLMNDEVRSRG
jgi:hypothetical protein